MRLKYYSDYSLFIKSLKEFERNFIIYFIISIVIFGLKIKTWSYTMGICRVTLREFCFIFAIYFFYYIIEISSLVYI